MSHCNIGRISGIRFQIKPVFSYNIMLEKAAAFEFLNGFINRNFMAGIEVCLTSCYEYVSDIELLYLKHYVVFVFFVLSGIINLDESFYLLPVPKR